MEVKAGYKQTEVGVIPEEWQVRPLFSLSTEIGDGIHSTPNYVMYSEFYFVNGNNLVNDRISITDNTMCVSQSEYKTLRKNLTDRTLLLSINGTIGNLAFYNGEQVVLGKSAAYINVAKTVSRTFISYCLKSRPTSLFFENELTGTTIRNLSLQSLRNTPFPLPPTIEEQRAIATALSDMDALINSLDRSIAKKRDLKQAAMQELLTGKRRLPGFGGAWEVKRLGDVVQINMGQSPHSNNYNQGGLGIPLIQGNADIENRKTIRRVWTTQITKSCNEGDLILTVRAPVGSIAIASEYSCLGRGVCSLTPFKSHAPFIFHSMVFAESQWKVLEQGSTFTSANSAQIAQFPLKVAPTLEEQTAIATVLSDVDAEIVALEQKRDKTMALKQGMMQELLTGRIRLMKNGQSAVDD